MFKKLIILVSILFGLFLPSYNLFAVSNDVKDVISDVGENRAGELGVSGGGVNSIKDFMFNIGNKIIAPIVFMIGLIIAFVGFYKLFFTDKEDDRKKGLSFVIYGIVGIIVSISASYLTEVLIGDNGNTGILKNINSNGGYAIANQLYEQVFSKFFSLFVYLVILVVFVILVVNLIKMISSPDKEDVYKQAKTIVIWNSIGIILILLSKNIIETFYKQFSTNSIDANGAILENTNLNWLYVILNYILGFIGFIIAVLVIYQAYLLLFKPDDDSTYKSLKKYFVYSIIGVLIIGGAYLIANFFIIK